MAAAVASPASVAASGGASAASFKFHTAFVNWHQTQAVFTIDFHRSGRIATGGADKMIKVCSMYIDYRLVLKIFGPWGARWGGKGGEGS